MTPNLFLKKHVFVVFLLFCCLVCAFPVCAQTEDLSQENQILKQDKGKLLQEIEGLKKDRDALVDSVNKSKSTSRQYSQEIEKLSTQITSLQGQLDAMKSAAQSGGSIEDALSALQTTQDVVDREEKTLDLLYKIDAFAESDPVLSLDAAKAHYNMGNIYFQRGEYEIAAREYYQAVTLMPDDADAHYNLAYVSGEHLQDYKTALRHYTMYLYLNPGAKDKPFVEKQILDVQLKLRNIIDSPLEKKDKQ